MSRKIQILVFLIFSMYIRPQQIDYITEQINSNNGLSHDCIQCVFQDSQGFIWIGSEAGLIRYDGNKTVEYVADPDDPHSISDNWIWAINENPSDSGKVLWIATKKGLNKFDRETGRFFLYKPEENKISNVFFTEVRKIYYDNGEILLVGEGLLKFNEKSKPFFQYMEEFDNLRILSFCRDYKNNLWIGSNNGLYRIFSENNIINYQIDCETNSQIDIETIYEDKNKNIWIGTTIGLYYFDFKKEKPLRPILINNDANRFRIHLISENSSGHLQAVSSKGLITLMPESDSTYFFSTAKFIVELKNQFVGSVIIDKSDIIWFATSCSGIYKLIPDRKKFKTYRTNPDDKYSLGSNWVTSFNEDKNGYIYVGTIGGGLNRFDKKTERFYQISPEDEVYRMHFDNFENLWYVNGESLVNVNKTHNKFVGSHYYIDDFSIKVEYEIFDDYEKNESERKLTEAHIHSKTEFSDIKPGTLMNYFYIDLDGVIWCTDGINKKDLYIFDPVDLKFNLVKNFNDEISAKNITLLYEDKNGTLWFGTEDRGLIRRSRDTDEYQTQLYNYHFYQRLNNDSSSLSNNSISAICEDLKGNLWIGTRDGLNMLDIKNEKFIRYKKEDGLSSELIAGILCDEKNNIWISTNNGILKFNSETNLFKKFDEKDGLPSNTFSTGSYFKDKNGNMYFGGANGFSVFNPKEINDNPHPPNVSIISFSLFNKEIKPGKKTPLLRSINFTEKIVLNYDQDVFTFEFAAMDYTEPGKNQYAYKMEGVNPDWVYTGASNPFATYTKLDPGEYIFNVKASNNDGVWNDHGTSIKVIILPPWWQTYWAFAFYTLFITSILYAGWRFNINRISLKHQAEIEHLQLMKYQEVEKIKSRFFANISHEFRTPLTLIIGPISNLLKKNNDKKIKGELNIVYRNAKRLLELVNQILDLAKLETGNMQLVTSNVNLIPILKGMVSAFASMAERKKITLNFASVSDELYIFVDLDKLEKIINNLVTNALKFTPQEGQIDISIICSSSFVEIIVKDSGIGISKELIDKIFNRFYQIENNNRRPHQGTGLGLSLTKELVELHGGEIYAESKEGEGTIFTVKLPLGKDHLKPEEISTDKVIFETNAENALEPFDEQNRVDNYELLTDSKKPILLIADDNLDVRTYIKSYFENDYRLIEAANGKDAFDKTIEYIPDLIVSDVMMPEYNGFELCAKLKADEKISHIPLILLTAKASDKDKINGLEKGADDYLMKPFDIKELQIKLKNLIKQKQRLWEHFKNEEIFDFSDKEITSVDKNFLSKLVKIIEANLTDPNFSIELLAENLFMSRQQLRRKLLSIVGQTPSDLMRRIRLSIAAKLINQNFGNISEVAAEVGFSNPAYFAQCFRKQFGIPPSEYQHKSSFKNYN